MKKSACSGDGATRKKKALCGRFSRVCHNVRAAYWEACASLATGAAAQGPREERRAHSGRATRSLCAATHPSKAARPIAGNAVRAATTQSGRVSLALHRAFFAVCARARARRECVRALAMAKLDSSKKPPGKPKAAGAAGAAGKGVHKKPYHAGKTFKPPEKLTRCVREQCFCVLHRPRFFLRRLLCAPRARHALTRAHTPPTRHTSAGRRPRRARWRRRRPAS